MSRPFRLLHVIDHLGLGGAQETLLSLVKYFDRRQFQVEVASLHGRGHYWEACRQAAVPVHSLSPHKYVPLYLPNLCRLLWHGRFDLIHCHLTAANLIAKPLAALLGVPFIFNYDQNDMFRTIRPWRRRLDGWANLITHHIVAVSASTRDFLIQQEKVPPAKITVVYNGVDLQRFQPSTEVDGRLTRRRRWGLPEKAPLVGGVGRLHQQKNFPLFLQVAREVLHQIPEVCFIIAGEGPERQNLESLARDLGIAAHVYFLGYVSDMTELYPALDLLLMTSRLEGTPLTVLEAMAMGVPVVAARVDGMAEILEDGKDAYLVPSREPASFARRTISLLQDQAIASRFSRAGQTKVRSQYSATAMVRRVEDLYLRYLED
jgi:glycosyltransferase involved in cell wall biosynthesis